MQLDRCQEEVAKATPPLIVESRSGTGKTLALLQRAAYHADTFDERSALFVTVSPRLRRQLHQKFEELNDAANLQLPPTSFYCFGAFIDELVKYCGVGSSFTGKDKCRCLAYVESRTSHHASATDALLVENEIAGVIRDHLLRHSRVPHFLACSISQPRGATLETKPMPGEQRETVFTTSTNVMSSGNVRHQSLI